MQVTQKLLSNSHLEAVTDEQMDEVTGGIAKWAAALFQIAPDFLVTLVMQQGVNIYDESYPSYN